MPLGASNLASRGSPPARASLPAVLLTLLAVAGAVVFGIYGPPVAGRSGLGGAVPLGDLVDATADGIGKAIASDFRSRDETDLVPEEARGTVQRQLGRSTRIPDLRDWGYGLRQVVPLSMPNAAFQGVGVLYRNRSARSVKWLMLVLVPDEGRYLTFDSLGRPHPMTPDTAFEGELPDQAGGPTSVLAWSDGHLLHLACVDDEDEADRLHEALGAP
jgi:hypothetical protein